MQLTPDKNEGVGYSEGHKTENNGAVINESKNTRKQNVRMV